MASIIITYDAKANAVYIRHITDKRIKMSKRTDEIVDGVLIDFDKDGGVFGIEILDVEDFEVKKAAY